MSERQKIEFPNEVFVAFKTAIARARHASGKEIELVTFADDTVSGFKRTYSSLYPFTPEAKLNEALTDIIAEIVPNAESRETLEKGFAEEPDSIKHHGHYSEAVSEWQTIFDNVAIGVRGIRDQRGESARSWYLRNTSRDKKK